MPDYRDLVAMIVEGRPYDELLAVMREGFAERGLGAEVVQALLGLATPTLCLVPVEERTSSWVGGADEVRLPTGASWPMGGSEPLSFIYEIDTTGLDPDGLVPHLPRGGALLVFHQEDDSYDDESFSATRVLWRDANDPGVVTREGEGYDWQPLTRRFLRGVPAPTMERARSLKAPVADGVTWKDVDEIVLDMAPGLHQAHMLCPPDEIIDPSLKERMHWWFREHGDEPLVGELFDDPALREGRGWRILLSQAPGHLPDTMYDLAWGAYGNTDPALVIPEVDLREGRFDRVITILHK